WSDDGSGDNRGYDNLQLRDGWKIAWDDSNANPLPTIEAIVGVSDALVSSTIFQQNGLKLLSKYIDTVAQERQYDSAISCASYVNSTITQWQNEANTFIMWRDSVLFYTIEQVELMQLGQRSVPTFEEFKTEFPEIVWSE